MHQISTYVYLDDALVSIDVPTGRLPHPYHDFPYLILESVLSPEECDMISSSVLENFEYVDASLRGSSVDHEIRKTKIHSLSPLHQELYSERFDACREMIEHFFSLSLSVSSEVQVLGYAEESFYVAHADDSSQLRNRSGTLIGFHPVAPERKVSTVLFLNDEYAGGELCFNYLYDAQGEPILLHPKRGEMIAFLSNPYFTHEVCTVTQGYRITLVQWHNALL